MGNKNLKSSKNKESNCLLANNNMTAYVCTKICMYIHVCVCVYARAQLKS
jgi:hypothetical protein